MRGKGYRGPLAAAMATLAIGGGLAQAAPGTAGAAQAGRPQAGRPQAGRPQAATVTIRTVAGGVGGPARATTVSLAEACGVAYAAGNAYIADGSSVREVNQATDRLTTPAGTGVGGPLGDGGPAARADVLDACAAVVDHAGNLVLVNGARILVVARRAGTFYGQPMAAGHIYTVAGNGTAGFSGDGGPAIKAAFRAPRGAQVDAAGNLLIADTRNNRVRVVAHRTGTFYGRPMKAGYVYTIAGDGTPGYSGDGGPATKAAFHLPYEVAVDAAANVLISDYHNNRVRVVAPRTGTFYGQPMKAGYVYTIAGDGTRGFSGDGGPATKAELNGPAGVAVDRAGNVLVADDLNNAVRVVAHRAGTFYGKAMVAGDIYSLAPEKAFAPLGVAVDGAGNLLISDSLIHVLRVVAAQAGTFYRQPMTAGHLYTVAGALGPVGYSGDGGPATRAEIGCPEGLAVDGAGNLLIGDTGGLRVRMVPQQAGTFYGQPMAAGRIYAVAGNGQEGYQGGGGPATSTEIGDPVDVAADGAGNLLIADDFDDVIWVVARAAGTFYGRPMKAGFIYVLAGNGSPGFSGDGGPATAAKLDAPAGVAVDAAGNLVIADTLNNRIRVVAASAGTFYGQPMAAGHIYTVAGNGTAGFSGDGGPATKAELNSPGVAVDAAGNLLIADTANNRIRVVAAKASTFYGQPMAAGHIYTVAGNGTAGFSGDGGPATKAELNKPWQVAPDGPGRLLIADTNDNRLREVAP